MTTAPRWVPPTQQELEFEQTEGLEDYEMVSDLGRSNMEISRIKKIHFQVEQTFLAFTFSFPL